ncbi:hypothetical protein DOTSEDRAFT_72888 [Dothistroma septosporum NZE10]|uniref:Uncharacterized protein n=1 Tax=Dothistroma septosporum (strain NZE10 / CBS 128990) TaxID=675120 RepID=M2WNU2_DOTSN|nr:hypothetical protein DOTSEDRAFT_72888 [Dothistroma septosporum NZE10]
MQIAKKIWLHLLCAISMRKGVLIVSLLGLLSSWSVETLKSYYLDSSQAATATRA